MRLGRGYCPPLSGHVTPQTLAWHDERLKRSYGTKAPLAWGDAPAPLAWASGPVDLPSPGRVAGHRPMTRESGCRPRRCLDTGLRDGPGRRVGFAADTGF